MTETRIEIPFELPNDKGVIVGILHRHDGAELSSSAQARPIALILHGVLAHKNQLYHRKLAQQLGMDSFRFDFRHASVGGESTTKRPWDMSTFGEDALDIHMIVKHLRSAYNYHVASIIAHSRGVLATWTYYWDVEMRRARVIPNDRDAFILDIVPFYVALSGRWDMQRMRLRFTKDLFQDGKKFEWKVRVAGKDVSVFVTGEMADAFCAYPMATMVDKFPASADCLLIHGTQDPTVPVQDVFAFMRKLQTDIQPARTRSSSNDLVIIEQADHSFKGHFDRVVDEICTWLDKRIATVEAKDIVEASPAAIEFQQRCPLRRQHSSSSSSSDSSISRL